MVCDPELELMVRAAPSAAAEARRAVAASGLVGADQVPTLLLLVSELVSNSVRHAGLGEDDQIRLVAFSRERRARVEVLDGGRSGRRPDKRPLTFGEAEPGGLGLVLVDRMADRWGVDRRDGQTRVWFELARAA
jgi:anti-sigma regulatory factor (Ser/Thr protein kinase)